MNLSLPKDPQLNAPRVSVVMPVRDAACTLEEAAASILCQTLDDFELIIVDDGSRDASPEVARRIAARDSRVRPIARGPDGIALALNSGIEASKGEYVARMDADDVSLPERLAAQVAHLDANPATGLVSCLVAFGGDAEAAGGYAHYVSWANSMANHRDISLYRFVESPLPHPSVMFRRGLAALHGGYRQGDFPEDYELWLRWLGQGVVMDKLPLELLRWNDPPGRLSRTDPRYSVEAFYRTKAGYLAAWLSRHNPFHPWIWLVGAGRTARKRAEGLTDAGIKVQGYVDIDPRKVGRTVHGLPVIHRRELPPPGMRFLVSYVGSRGAGGEIADWLDSRGYAMGRDYILAA